VERAADRPGDYAVASTGDESARLRNIFPEGVWSIAAIDIPESWPIAELHVRRAPSSNGSSKA
jgi:hypothetical protein